MNVTYPFQIDARGRTALATDDAYLEGMIEQVLFTSPGERVNRPDFGTGLLQLVFAPNSDALQGALEMTIRAALQQWLGNLLDVQDLDVTSVDSTLSVMVRYQSLQTNSVQTATFTRSV